MHNNYALVQPSGSAIMTVTTSFDRLVAFTGMSQLPGIVFLDHSAHGLLLKGVHSGVDVQSQAIISESQKQLERECSILQVIVDLRVA